MPTPDHQICDGFRIQRHPAPSFPFEQYPPSFLLSNVITWGIWLMYMAMQGFTISRISSMRWTLLRLWIAWLAEFCLTITELLFGYIAIYQSLTLPDTGESFHYQLVGDDAPYVDIFITCCGESIDVIFNTISAAIHQDYPVQKFRVFVLDDGHSELLRKKVTELGEKFSSGPEIHYRSRNVAKGQLSYRKSGNLRFGLEESARHGGHAFIACLDADMIAHSTWLRSLIPHLLLDPKIGLVGQPQQYYNIPSGDPLGQQAQFDYWWTIFLPISSKSGTAICVGTGFIARREALEQIGGWPLAYVGEDIICSGLLIQHNWKVVFIRQNLQFGLAPDSYLSHLKQKIRWFDAVLQCHTERGFYLTETKENQAMTLLQKTSALLDVLRDLSPILIAFSLVLLPLSILPYHSTQDFATTSLAQYRNLRRVFFLAYLLGKIREWVLCRHIGLSQYSNWLSNDVWSAPYIAIRALNTLFASGSAVKAWTEAGPDTALVHERSPARRTNVGLRLWDSGLLPHLAYVITTSAILSMSLWQTRNLETSSDIFGIENVRILVLPGAAVKMSTCIWKAAAPVIYMIFPPTMPSWRELLYEDGEGVLRPKDAPPIIMDPVNKPKESGNTRLLRDLFEICVLFCVW